MQKETEIINVCISSPVWLCFCPPGCPTGGVAQWEALESCLCLFGRSLFWVAALLGGKVSPYQSAAGKLPLYIAVSCKKKKGQSFSQRVFFLDKCR